MYITTCSLPLFRYRNFRTFTSPHPVQFSCLTVDSSGEVVSSGSLDTFEVFVWSMKTGRLLEVILHNFNFIPTITNIDLIVK